MKEIGDILKKYDEQYVIQCVNSVDDLNSYAGRFYRDVAEIFDSITRIRSIERNSAGFSIDDAPILGLLVRVWKLLKELIRYYEENNAEFIGLFERPLLEAAVTATYLMQVTPLSCSITASVHTRIAFGYCATWNKVRPSSRPREAKDCLLRSGKKWSWKV